MWATRDPAEWAAMQDAERSLERSRAIWRDFSQARGFRLRLDASLPSMLCRVEGISIAVVARGDAKRGYLTEISATARHAMRGAVIVRPTTTLDRVRRALGSRFVLNAPDLDALLTVRAATDALGRAVLDERTIAFLHAVVSRPLRSLRYEDGEVLIRWAGVERSTDLLAEAVELAAHLAVTGTAVAPYR